MKLLFLLFVLPLAFSAQLKIFEIDLDGNPLTRYDHVTSHFIDQMLLFKKVILDLIPKFAQNILKRIYSSTIRNTYPEYALEMRGLGKSLNITEDEVFIVQTCIDLFSSCTSIVIALPDGSIIHGRNLDYDFAIFLKRIQYLGIFKRGGREVYRCVSFSGLIGQLTCVKKGKFAVSFNERNDESGSALERTIRALAAGNLIVNWSIRGVMDKANSYAEALSMLQKTKTSSFTYLTISGTGKNEGAVITRERDNVLNLWQLSDKEWFLVQVNTDWWKPIPPDETDRRNPAIDRIKKIGRENITLQRLLKEVMVKYPNNHNNTTFCSVMYATNGTFIIEPND